MNMNTIIQSMIQQLPSRCNNKEMADNFMRLFQSNDTKGLEDMARNILKSNNMTLEQAQHKIMAGFR